MAVKSNIVTVSEAGEAATIDISVSPASLPPSGGDITISGKTTLPSGTPISIYVNGSRVDTFTTGGSSFTQTYAVPANATTFPRTLSIYAEG